MKLFVFDMGHVFVDFEWESVCEGFCQRSTRTREELKDAFRQLAQLGYESGRINTDDFLAELNKHLDCNIDRAEFTKLWTATFRENTEMALLMQELRRQRPLYLLSNTNEIHYEYLESSFQVSRHFDELILSYKVGSSKPEPEIYEEVLRRSGMAPEDCFFIDDLNQNVEAARRLGIRAHRFTGIQELKNELVALGFQTGE